MFELFNAFGNVFRNWFEKEVAITHLSDIMSNLEKKKKLPLDYSWGYCKSACRAVTFVKEIGRVCGRGAIGMEWVAKAVIARWGLWWGERRWYGGRHRGRLRVLSLENELVEVGLFFQLPLLFLLHHFKEHGGGFLLFRSTIRKRLRRLRCRCSPTSKSSANVASRWCFIFISETTGKNLVLCNCEFASS